MNSRHGSLCHRSRRHAGLVPQAASLSGQDQVAAAGCQCFAETVPVMAGPAKAMTASMTPGNWARAGQRRFDGREVPRQPRPCHYAVRNRSCREVTPWRASWLGLSGLSLVLGAARGLVTVEQREYLEVLGAAC
jgi:hypothetical protein